MCTKNYYPFPRFFPKGASLDRDDGQYTGHVISNIKNVLHAEVMNDEEDIELIQFRVPMSNKASKECDHDDTLNLAGHKLSHFEPIVLRFNTKYF